MIKILHCADLHLDSPIRHRDLEKSRLRREELKSTFSSLVAYIRTAGIDICLIAGDLFDSEYVTGSTVELVRRELASVPSCRFVIAPGNHDPFCDGGVYSSVDFSDNVYIFKSQKLECFSFPELGADVYGYAFVKSTMDENPFAGKRPAHPERINLLCAHGDTSSPISSYCPITREDILSGGFDYVALGHIHTSPGIKKERGTWYGYSGCLEGRDFGEPGHHGAMVAAIEKEYGLCSVKVSGVRFSRRRYETCSVDLGGSADAYEADERIASVIRDRGYGGDTVLRIRLIGDVSPELEIDVEHIIRRFGGLVFELEVKDETVPIYDADYLSGDPSVRGEFYRKLLPLLRDGSSDERRTATEALRMGLAALRGEDIKL